MNTNIEFAKLEIIATGGRLADIEENAALAENPPVDTFPDLVRFFASFVNEGFAVSNGNQYAKPSMTIDSVEFDAETVTQRWVASVQFLDTGYLRVLDNLLRTLELDSLQITLRQIENAANVRQVIDARLLAYPKLRVKPSFEVDYVAPPTDVSLQSRKVQIEFRHHLAKDEAARYCESLNSWSELVGRSGFCPADLDPGDCGAMPSFAYQYDPQTIELGFEEYFVFDEACFVSVIAYFMNVDNGNANVGMIRIR
jgi:hypothetical protein